MINLLLYVICGLCVYWKLLKKERKVSLTPPDLPGKLPLLGHAHLFWGDSTHVWKLIEWVGKETVKLGGVAILSIGPKTGYAITDPDDCMTAANTCLEKEYYYGFAVPWLGEGLLTGNDTTLGIKIYDDFGISEDYENALEQMLYILTERFKKIWLHSDFIYKWSNLKKRQDEVVKILHQLPLMALKKRKEERKNIENGRPPNPDNFKSFLDVMLEVTEGNDYYTEKDVLEDVDNILFAGHDTMSTALTVALLILGSDWPIQEKAYKEIRDVFGDSDRDVDKEDLPKLVYLEAIIKESLRLYPVGPVVARYVDADVKLKNFTMKQGGSCFLFFSGLHQHPMWGPDVKQFRPERWLDGSLPRNSNVYGAFSLGRRSCIGKSYALMLTKVMLTHVLRQYRVSGDVTNLVLKLEALLKPDSGFEIGLESRI